MNPLDWSAWRDEPRRRGRGGATVFRWDLDKTYLKVDFERMRDLVRIPFERAEDKVDAPGVAVLIRSLREVAHRRKLEARVYFLTASPPQIGRAIKEKLALDGVEYDGITFKNQLQNIARGKFRNLREQVGFKLTELLKAHRDAPRGAREFLFGDDWESDPLVYSLYADILAGRVGRAEVHDVLAAIRVDPELIDLVKRLMSEREPRDVVARIYISLERRTPPANFRWFGRRLVPTFNYFQTAVCLFGDGVLDAERVAAVGRSLLDRSGYTRERLTNSFADVLRRGHLAAADGAALRDYLRAQGIVSGQGRRRRAPSLWVRVLPWFHGGEPAAAAPEKTAPIDYRALIAEWRPTS